MVVIHVSVKARTETVTAFTRQLSEVVAQACRTEGCLKYEWYTHPDTVNRFVIYGEFETEEHFNQYLASSVVNTIETRLIPLLEEPPTFKHLQAEEM